MSAVLQILGEMLNIHKKFESIRKTRGEVIVLDGGLGTQLESCYNATLNSNKTKNVGNLWCGNVLLDAPSLVERAHKDFVEAGATIGIHNIIII